MKGAGRAMTATAERRRGQISELTEKIKRFRDDRDWLQFHNHKDMALSLMLEAAEVLEHFQWKSIEECKKHAEAHRGEIADELADVAMYLFELADNLGVDLPEAIEAKLAKNTAKYPVERAKGKHTKYNCL
jgi:NTP pyrophosphatase (non-canonical NTP hydrolase)